MHFSAARQRPKKGEKLKGIQDKSQGSTEFFLVSHGQVPDPDQNQSERALAHDQPLLSGCERACALYGTQALGEGSGSPPIVPSPSW